MYDKRHEKDRCPHCGSENISSTVKDTIANVVCEESYDCDDCGENVDYWAYGYYMSGICK